MRFTDIFIRLPVLALVISLLIIIGVDQCGWFYIKKRCETAEVQVKQAILKNNRYWLSKNSIGHSCIEITK
ncbi:hypothetical protein BIT28_15945 [Photobacterium proteolyticum]|uniref:Uncharacterized protein n=1 Tax=Photobacterium proteolyticum TaxID=1903952 RepID=A0A1Q9GYX7_9GAMM|nr:hypothetical protein BIT28_15945 [Photobacterium proteolyticum]